MKIMLTMALAVSLLGGTATPVNDRYWRHPARSEVEEFVRATMPSDRQIMRDMGAFARERLLQK